MTVRDFLKNAALVLSASSWHCWSWNSACARSTAIRSSRSKTWQPDAYRFFEQISPSTIIRSSDGCTSKYSFGELDRVTTGELGIG
jgi:hypothetical protein